MPEANLPETAVGLDIETTSLDPTQGEIIEVAAIRFNLKTGEIKDRFEQLLASRSPLTAEITALTNITNDMLAGQPSFASIAFELTKFIGADTLLAHNANFDLTWLSTHGCPLKNPVWDTFVLGSVAWPEAASYNLGTLARDLSIAVSGEHRAAADIMLTFGVFQAARIKLPRSAKTIEQVQSLLATSGQDHYSPLFQVTNQPHKKGSAKNLAAVQPSEKALTVDDILGDQGALSRSLPGFQTRPQQVALSHYIVRQAQAGQGALIEAGAGIGKTFAYLGAGLSLDGRILVSTYTRVLQDQLVDQDIPRLLNALGITRRVAALKGRRHYVCQRRLAAALRRSTHTPGEAWGLIKILLWLEAGGTGDLERLNFSHQGRYHLRTLHADNPVCRLQCSRQSGVSCPYQKARQAATQADITVINHSLLLGWGTGDEQPIDAYRLIVIDEAHHVEDAAIAASAIDFSPERLQEITAAIGRVSNNAQIKRECATLSKEYDHLLRLAYTFLESHTTGTTLRLTSTVRRSSTFNLLANQAQHIISRLHFVIGLLRANESTFAADQQKIYRESVREAEGLAIELSEYIDPTAPDRVQWLKRDNQEPRASLCDACMNPQPYIQTILSLGSPVIFLSATLTANNSFVYIQRRLGLESLATEQFPGEFDYQKNMKIFVIDNGLYPNTEKFDQFVAKQIQKATTVTRGRLLALFTSQASLENVHTMIRSALYKENIKLFSQGLTGGRHNIAKRFVSEDASVLLGSGSFWEGFDSPGETLSVVVIPRLPFPQLGDPIIEALSEQVGERRAFQEVMLPRMILRFRQGIGRLLRTHSDRGVIIILDRRIVEKEYGRETLHSLPPAPVEILSGEEVSQSVAQWFGKATINRWHTPATRNP